MTNDEMFARLVAHPYRAQIAEALERAAVRACADSAWRWAGTLFRIAQEMRR